MKIISIFDIVHIWRELFHRVHKKKKKKKSCYNFSFVSFCLVVLEDWYCPLWAWISTALYLTKWKNSGYDHKGRFHFLKDEIFLDFTGCNFFKILFILVFINNIIREGKGGKYIKFFDYKNLLISIFPYLTNSIYYPNPMYYETNTINR